MVAFFMSVIGNGKLSKSQRIITLNMVKDWFVGIKIVDEQTISRLGFVAQALNQLEVEHLYDRAQLQENVITVIKSELTRCRHNVVVKVSTLIKGMLNFIYCKKYIIYIKI